MRSLHLVGVPLLHDEMAARCRDAGAEVDIAATILHARQHDVLGQHTEQRCVVRIVGLRIEGQRDHDELNLRVTVWAAVGFAGVRVVRHTPLCLIHRAESEVCDFGDSIGGRLAEGPRSVS